MSSKTKSKKCVKGFPCGYACISRTKQCWANLSSSEGRMAETFAQFVNRIVGLSNDKESAIKTETPKKLPKDYLNEINSLAESLLDDFSDSTLDRIAELSKKAYDDYVSPILSSIKEKYGSPKKEADELSQKYVENKNVETYTKDIISNVLQTIGISDNLSNLKVSFDYTKNSSYDYSTLSLNINPKNNYNYVIPHEFSHDLELRQKLDLSRFGSNYNWKSQMEELNIPDDELISDYSKRVYFNSQGDIVATELISTFFEVAFNINKFTISDLVNNSGELKQQYALVKEILNL